jgi:hypothetical protein
MLEINFHTEHEADIYLKQHIKNIPGIQDVHKTYLADRIKENIKEIELPHLEDGMIGLMIPKFRYVIKNEDLPIFESLFDGLKTAAGANFFITETTYDINKTWAAAIGIFSSLYKLYKNIRNKGKTLPFLEFQVLLCLKNYPAGLELDYLLFLLRKNHITLDGDQLKQLLEGLGRVYMNDGTKKELVIMEGKLYKAKGL